MIYGISGSSGTGKSTVATMVADAMSLTFVRTSITDCARKHGFDAVGNLSITKRIELQFHLLNDMLDLIEKADRPAILDRTPIDMIAYMLGEVGMHSHEALTMEQMKLVETYVGMCMNAARKHFDHIFLLGPIPVYFEVSTRPALNPAYQVHTQMIMRGALETVGEDVGYSILSTTELNTRVDHVCEIITMRMNNLEAERRTHAHVH